MESLQSKYDTLVKKYQNLLDENEKLKSILYQHGIDFALTKVETPLYSPILFPSVQLSLDDKVSLFRSVFRGREDVFARRWYSKTTNRSGYQPVCINEWDRSYCDKKKYKCADCPNRNFAPLSDRDVYRHLEGKDNNGCDVIGLYAIMLDNNCTFLCTDFDDKSCTHGYKDDVTAFVGVCKDWNIPYAIERSRSGNGAHVWIFLEQPLSASKVRRLGNAILTEAMNKDGRISFSSYDRFFPNQDTIPEGGFGNLVALPLQGKARRSNNSVFVDDQFLPFKDQWAYLYNIKKINKEQVDAVIVKHPCEELGSLTTSSESKPWVIPSPQNISQEDFNGKITITKADQFYIPLQSVTAKALNHLKRIAAFKNPEFYSKQAMRISTYNIPRIISCADITDNYIAMPRGCEDAIKALLDSNNVSYEIVDETNHGTPISVSFKGVEREEQLDAIHALLPYPNGVLSATTAFGKTVTAAALIAHKKVNTLILVHTKALLAQWHDRLAEFLTIEYTEPKQNVKRGRKKVFSPIGCLDSTSDTLHGVIDIALMQSCFEKGEVKPFVRDYGMVIVDECHHVSSVTFENVLKHLTAQNVYGLTATHIRKDGHQPIIFMQCGPIRFSADAKSQILKQAFQRFLVPRFTSFRSITDDKKSFTALSQMLAEDEVRNNLIMEDVCRAVTSGRTPIILTNRTSHVERLVQMLEPRVKHVIQLIGTGTAKEKREALQRLHEVPDNEPLVVVATGKYVGEGFDYPRLDTLFLVLPISWKGLVAQYAGRLHRENEGKKDVRIYDYIDIHEPICDSMYRKRLKGYAAIGYRTMTKEVPTLFDKVEDLCPFATEGQIFNGRTFFKLYFKDIKFAKHSVIISSPKLYNVNQNPLVLYLKELTAHGIEVSIFTSKRNEQTEFLIRQGLYVKVIAALSLCTTIIDKSIVWYGSVNTLGFASEEDNIIKVTDNKLSAELMAAIYE